MIVYHPNELKLEKKLKLDPAADAGVVDETTAIAKSPENTAAAITANWLALSGREKELST